MLVPRGRRDPLRAVLFDLDTVLIDNSVAWRYTIEESIASVCGRRISAEPLADAYRGRPWRHALAVILEDRAEIERCEQLCEVMTLRSSMKRLTVYEGTGMALDTLRGARIEMGVITRAEHSLALKQIQSTGLDRFLSVLAPTPRGELWEPAERLADCLRFLEQPSHACAFISADPLDLAVGTAAGFHCFVAQWAVRETDTGKPSNWPGLEQPAALAGLR